MIFRPVRTLYRQQWVPRSVHETTRSKCSGCRRTGGSQIAKYDSPHRFREAQVTGPYRLWDHRHRLWRESGRTLIEDFVVYDPPLGPLRAVLDALMSRRQLAAIFEYRGGGSRNSWAPACR